MEQSYKESRIMGIDYGEKRIGIALSDPLFTFAYPYTTLKNDLTFLTNLSKIIAEKKIIKTGRTIMSDITILDGKKVLVVDDEPDVVETVEELLPMCQVTCASNFAEAEELL